MRRIIFVVGIAVLLLVAVLFMYSFFIKGNELELKVKVIRGNESVKGANVIVSDVRSEEIIEIKSTNNKGIVVFSLKPGEYKVTVSTLVESGSELVTLDTTNKEVTIKLLIL